MSPPVAVGTLNNLGNAWQYLGVAGTGDTTVVIATEDVSRNDLFMFSSSAGAMQVYGCIDDTNFYGPLSLDDLGATVSSPVTITAAARIYRLRGTFRYLQVKQSGGTAVAGACLLASRTGLGW